MLIRRAARRSFVSWCNRILVALTLAVAGGLATAQAANQVVISQIYGGGGNAGAILRNDFVELLNRGTTPVDINNWCLQYASATGSFTLGNSQSTTLGGTIAPGGYYLIQLGAGAGGTQDLPVPDATGNTAVA